MAKAKKETKAKKTAKTAKGGILTATDVRAKSKDELNGLLLDSKKELFNIRFQQSSGEQVATSRPRQIRKNIARIKTVLNEVAKNA